MPSPNPAKTLVKLAAKFFEGQAQRALGERFIAAAEKEFASYGGNTLTAKIADWLSQEDRTGKMLTAFEDADHCFAEQCGDDTLAQWIKAMPLRAIPTLEKLADALPQTFDERTLVAALHERMRQDWSALSDAQLDHAAHVYADCLDRSLTTKCGQLLPTLFRHVEEIRDGVREMLPLVKDMHDKVSGASPWQRPSPPRAEPGFVGRAKELDDVRKLLAPGTRTTITATIHGTPGVGKTWLARHLAAQLDSEFPGGVIFQKLGSGHRHADQCVMILDEWAHNTGCLFPPDQHLSPSQVRNWLAGHGAMLIVLDDIWDVAAAQPLLDAAPLDASVLTTTRNSRIAKQMGNQVFPLDILSPDDALALLRARMDKATDADVPLLQQLAHDLGYHAMALDIAGAAIARRRDKTQWKALTERLAREVINGRSFGDLPFEGEEERESRVEAAVKLSYDDLKPLALQRFRTLGAFAPDASFRTEFAAALWECSPDEAQGQLTEFYERGLLSDLSTQPPFLVGKEEQNSPSRPGEGTGERLDRWQQHLLLRDYALALLRKTSEEDATRRKHAKIFLSAMRDADDKQIYYVMLPDYAQLSYAIEWTIEHDLGMAQGLISSTRYLQQQFGFVRDSDDWSARFLKLAQDSGDDKRLGDALVIRGTIVSDLANLPGEDRAARLHESLAVYDAALQFYRPDTAPLDYATTQNNRGIRLSDLANLPGEDRAARLRESLAAYDEALRFRRPDTAPLDYAMTQNNRGNKLSDLANLPGEDRAARLCESLAAYDEALRFHHPDTAPLDYAMTQSNLANLWMSFADMPGEEQRACWQKAIRCAVTALSLFLQLQHEPYAQHVARQSRWIAETCGETFPELWKDLELGQMPEWLMEKGTTTNLESNE